MKKSQGIIAVLAAGMMGTLAHAAVLPYTQDFASSTTLTRTPSSNFNVAGGKLRETQPSVAVDAGGTAAVQITNAGNENTASWSMSAQFKVNSYTLSNVGGKGFTFGFGALGSNVSFSGGSGSPYYLADFTFDNRTDSNDGTLRILEIASTNTTVATGKFTLSGGAAYVPDSTKTYLLTLSGTYVGASGINLQLTLDNGIDPAFVVNGSDSTKLTGQYFGVRDRIGAAAGGGNASAYSIDIDNLNIVPEPSVAAMVFGATAMSLLSRRRWRRAV